MWKLPADFKDRAAAKLKEIFHVELVWVEKGRGNWVRRKKFHPILRVGFGLLLFCALAGGAGVFFNTRTAPSGWDVGGAEDVVDAEDADAVVLFESGDVRPFDDGPFPDPGPLPPALASVKQNERWIRIKKGLFRLYLYQGDGIDHVYEIAIGKNKGNKERAGDNRTPDGVFTVESIEDSRAWTHDFQDGRGEIAGAYGPWFIRLKTGWQGIGIHGTHDPDSRGAMVSEGCVRMLNGELEELRAFVRPNMKVVIEE
ncbi:MAG: L,D-transpeptidase [Synergistaceae bacterium]|jgi:lipoprotein-anchoring transpeptidase ErfK/SrfK|nr:L,D-transpeptidase [Synergistaceae bacterium]